MSNYQANSTTKRRAQSRYQEFDWIQAKPEVDAVDVFLAQHYGLKPEQLDFVINYDIKVRVGSAEEHSDD